MSEHASRQIQEMVTLERVAQEAGLPADHSPREVAEPSASSTLLQARRVQAHARELRWLGLDILEEAIRAADNLAANMRRLRRPAQAELYKRRADFIRQRLALLRSVLEELDGLHTPPTARQEDQDGNRSADDDGGIPSALLERSLDALAAEFGLTRREREVAALMAMGRSNKDIAAQLVITHGTVANHVQRVLAKLGCSSRAQVILMAVNHDRLRRHFK